MSFLSNLQRILSPVPDIVAPASLLILGRLFNVIDDENLHWAFFRFQFQPKLLLDRREDRRPGRIRRACVARPLLAAFRPLQHRHMEELLLRRA